MKTRAGFVSNSSTSSYVLILKKADFKAVVKAANPLARAIVKQIQVDDDKFGEEAVKVLSWLSGNYSSFEDMDISEKVLKTYIRTCTDDKDVVDEDGYDLDDYKWDYIYECWDEFTEEASKKGILVSVDS